MRAHTHTQIKKKIYSYISILKQHSRNQKQKSYIFTSAYSPGLEGGFPSVINTSELLKLHGSISTQWGYVSVHVKTFTLCVCAQVYVCVSQSTSGVYSLSLTGLAY